jgi:branched-chain amino acid transport system ATP-binding protein
MAIQLLNGNAPAPTSEPLLSVTNVEVVYGGSILAVRGVSLEVPPGAIVAVLGANGAGKTTTLRAISGLLPLHDAKVTEGSIRFLGQNVEGKRAEERVHLGIGQVPEGRRLFAHLSVEENLRVGAAIRSDRNGIRADLERVYQMFPPIAGRRRGQAGWLSGGEQQMVAVGRALLGRPKLLLIDELTLGLAPQVVHQIFERLREINRSEGTAILLVEQNAHQALELCQYAYVMENGRIVLDGTPDDLRANPDVKDFYLGGSHAASGSFAAVKHYKRRKRWS